MASVTDTARADAQKPEPAPARLRWWPLSRLTRRIVMLNVVGLAILLAGVLYMNQFRAGLIELRVQSLTTQGEIIATALGEAATAGEPARELDQQLANLVLDQLVAPTRTRARLFDTEGRLIADTRLLQTRGEVTRRELPPPAEGFAVWRWVDGVYTDIMSWLTRQELPLYREYVAQRATDYPESARALIGDATAAVRQNSEGEVVVTVAVPVRRLRVVFGALMLSTEGENLDEIVREERAVIIQMFLIAVAVMALLSVFLARNIARPIRRLAASADLVGLRAGGLPEARAAIPDLGPRNDEIGDLSISLRRMTAGLYDRIEAIESFAADVAHELKNPLTSLRSAVETLGIAKTDAQRERLSGIIAHDVDRLDRLISDISNASRLDAELVREAREAVDLKALLGAVIALKGVSDDAGLRLRLDVAAAAPTVVAGLESRLGQVVDNLVDNAISFSPEGATVALSLNAASLDGRPAAEIAVADEGSGIPEEALEAIFERFYTHRPAAGGFGGHSGLGLSISRQIVEAHGGEIRAENRDGGGARFIVTLPVE